MYTEDLLYTTRVASSAALHIYAPMTRQYDDFELNTCSKLASAALHIYAPMTRAIR